MFGLLLVSELLLCLIAFSLYLIDRRQVLIGYFLTAAIVVLLLSGFVYLKLSFELILRIFILFNFLSLFSIAFAVISYKIKEFKQEKVSAKQWIMKQPLYIQLVFVMAICLILFLVTYNTPLRTLSFFIWFNRVGSFFILYFGHLVLSYFIMQTVLMKSKIPPNPEYILILGKYLEDGQIDRILVSRLRKAFELFNYLKKEVVLIMSGGPTNPSLNYSEARVMAKYIHAQGVPAPKILLEEKSIDTKTNMVFTERLLKYRDREEQGVFITSDYHLMRASVYAKQAGLNAVGVGVSTYYIDDLEEYLKNHLFEMTTMLYVYRWIHLAIVGVIIVGSLVLI
ncbi:YdcF family protein [Atopobacter phocae]|uniref:YdcF family protein n=1 Tax=Atopobacter phocae TaxID=136492 RepID=UPI00046EB892|nr:YdcF family protein [Atopobacter phocae]